MASYDLKAILGEKLKRLTDKALKAIVDCMCTVSAALCSLEKRISALESVEIPEGGYKPMQEPVASPSASGTAIQFIESVSQYATGRMTATKKTVRSASTSQTGVVQLTDSHSSTSTSTAATPKNVKEAYDLASGKADPSIVVDSATYDSSSHTIVFKHGSTQLFTLDAAAFVKDGMVDSVAISNGNLVITFNTDAGKQPISIPLTDIFNPNNYYTKSATDVLLASKVDSTDSRLLPDADVFVATYTEQAAGTTMEELEAARTAGKKIYVNVGGATSGGNTYEKMIPLTYVRYNNGSVTGYFFETVIDSLVSSSDSGKITTYWRAANGWGHTTSEVKYAETAGTANEATNAKGYVEGEAIAQGLASKMSITADNAAVGALQNLCGQISVNILTDLVDGSDIITSYPGPDGMSTQGHVNQLYASKALRVYNYIKSKLVSQKDVATPPSLALLDAPKYYWCKPNGDVVTSYVRVVDSTKSASSYYNLGNSLNASTRWGVCHVPLGGTLAGTYVEIDFDIALRSYYIDSGWLIGNPYANLDLPYIMKFVAATRSNDGDAVISIPTSSNTIFASTTLSIDCMRGDTKSFGHVHMSGRIGASTASNEAIFICALCYHGMDNVAALAEMGNVRVKATYADQGMT